MHPLVFLHGWAQSQQIWFQQREQFSDALFLNLPGHGGVADIGADQWVENIQTQLPDEPCILVGWSLGGMLALAIAQRFPQQVAALALISSTPCFRQQTDWSAGCDDTLFAAFEEAVSSQSPRLLNRFFGLMLHGDKLNRRDHNALAKQAVDRQYPTSLSGLQAGLHLLATLDTRQHVSALPMPALVIHGQADVIVSGESGAWLADQLPNSQYQLFQDCGHAPFLTQPERFNTILHDWWTSL